MPSRATIRLPEWYPCNTTALLKGWLITKQSTYHSFLDSPKALLQLAGSNTDTQLGPDAE